MPSLRAYRRSCAATFGRLSVVQTTAAATGPDAASTIVSEQLLGVDLGPTTLSQRWAYVVDDDLAGEQRRLTSAPLDGELGTLAVVAPFSSVLFAGTEVELLGPIPADRDPMGLDGWRQYVNRALSKLTRRDRVTLTADGSYRYPLTAYPWLIDTDRIYGLLLDYGASWGNARPLPSGWQIVWDGELGYLETDGAYTATTGLVLAVNRPADTRIKRSGVWTDTAGIAATDGDDGLLADTDEAIPPVGIVTVMAIREALMCRHQWSPMGTKQSWQLEEARWSAKALRAKIAYEGGHSRPVQTGVRRAFSTWPKALL